MARKDTGQASLLLGLAAFALGQGLQVANGNLHPDSIKWLTVTLGLALAALLAPTVAWVEARVHVLLPLLVVTGLGWQFTQLFTAMPGMYLRLAGIQTLFPFFTWLVVAAVAAGAASGKDALFPRALPVVVVGAFVACSAWMLKTSPEPFIDVFVFQRDGVRELLAGRNPYAMQYPDIYGNSPFYGEGLSVNGKLQFGYPYPPLSLLLAIPGHVLGGDYRWSQVAALAVAGLFIAYSRPGPTGTLLSALFLFTPRSFFVVEQGWTEPFVALGLAGTVFCSLRFPRGLPWVLGLFLATKQYLVFAAPATWLLVADPRPAKKDLLRMLAEVVGIAAVVSLPMALWDVKAFWHDVAALQVYQPFRVEAMSYLAWWAGQGHERLPTALAFLAAAGGVGLGLWRAPRTAGGFALTCCLAFLGFFAFNKQAFCNYYAFVVGALCVAAAAMQPVRAPANGAQ